MKEISKKDLMSQLIESYMEVDEMADFKKQKGIEKSWEPIMSEPGDEGDYKTTGQKFRGGMASGEHIGHKVIDKSTGNPVVIFYPCQRNIEEFVATHKEAIERLKQQYGDVYITDSNTIPKCEPRLTGSATKSLTNLDTNQSKEVNRKVDFASEISDANYIKRYLLYPLINQVLLGDGTVQNHLERCSLPRIKVSDRANLDRHSAFSNNELTYQTLNFYSYKDVRDFFNAAVRNVQDNEVTQEEKDYREYHLARQFNKVYYNWEKTKKNNSIWRGFTDIYNLEASGYASQPFDVTVSSLLTIKGIEMLGNGYKWSVEFTTEHGKQLKDNSQLGRMKLVKDYELKSEESVNTQTSTSNKDSLVKNRDVYDGLVQCLEDIKQQILQIPVQDQLKRAKLVRFELTPEEKMDLKRQRQERLSGMNQNQGEEQPELNENQINTIVQNVLREIKK
jgi:predicted metal-binding transcription factor (methanogenesis marker protein 9)